MKRGAKLTRNKIFIRIFINILNVAVFVNAVLFQLNTNGNLYILV
jgi:hypothetical protein